MGEKKDEAVKDLRDTGRLFSRNGRAEQETWIVRALLEAIGEKFEYGQVKCNKVENDSVDVIFCDAGDAVRAKFQVKMLLDAQRKPTKEYRDRAEELEKSDKESEMVSHSDAIKYLTLQEILNSAHEYLAEISSDKKYCPAVRKCTDLVVYINKKNEFLNRESSKKDIPDWISRLGWRSVSIVRGESGAVLYASNGAPEFLRVKKGNFDDILKITHSHGGKR